MTISNCEGDWFNIEAVCPDYLPESQCSFTWHRDEGGVAIVSGYDPENDPEVHWLCWCGNFITDGCCHCAECGAEAPWGCDCGIKDDYDEDQDFGFGYDFEPDYESEER